MTVATRWVHGTAWFETALERHPGQAHRRGGRKADRPTRSLADFAKIVELFDAHQGPFVSVAQSFNITSFMGRLTPNVPLAVAWFEEHLRGQASTSINGFPFPIPKPAMPLPASSSRPAA